MKLTPWFSGDAKPVREGVYQVAYWNKDQTSYSYWDGSKWGYSFSDRAAHDDIYLAFKHRDTNGFKQSMPWRGVAK